MTSLFSGTKPNGGSPRVKVTVSLPEEFNGQRIYRNHINILSFFKSIRFHKSNYAYRSHSLVLCPSQLDDKLELIMFLIGKSYLHFVILENFQYFERFCDFVSGEWIIDRVSINLLSGGGSVFLVHWISRQRQRLCAR